MSDLAVVVDEQDNIIGYKDRHALQPGDIIRISSLWIENDNGEVLISQRSLNKKSDPGLWAAAAAGTLEPDETYESNVAKEAEEELGVVNVPLRPIKRLLYRRSDGTGRYIATFRAIVNKKAEDFKLQKEEVERVAWVDKQKLLKDVETNPSKYVQSAETWRMLFE